MNINKIIELMYNWYSKIEVQYKIVEYTTNRELSFLIPSWCDKELRKASVRMLKCHSIKHFNFLVDVMHVFSNLKPYNFYYTLAKYKNGIPNQNMSNLRLRNNTEWNLNNYKEIIGYDFLIDIDSPDFINFEFCYDSAKELKNLFKVLNVPHKLIFSGKGFHFIISYNYIKSELSFNPQDEQNIYKLYSEIALKLFDLISEMIDTSIYDSRRLCKIPYTLAIYEDKINVCCPINSDEQFNNFNLDDYNINNFMEFEFNISKIFNETGNFNNLIEYLKDYKIINEYEDEEGVESDIKN